MNTTVNNPVYTAPARAATRPVEPVRSTTSLARIWSVLRFTYGLVPIVAGLDKFTNLLVNWESYLNPAIMGMIPVSGRTIMAVVGCVEIAAGIIVLVRPRLGGFLVMAWLFCIALSLVTSGRYLDVAVRDLVMAVGAYTLANLTPAVERMYTSDSSVRS